MFTNWTLTKTQQKMEQYNFWASEIEMDLFRGLHSFMSSLQYVCLCVYSYWTGYLRLCCELQRRPEAFQTICQLDDISLLEDPDGGFHFPCFTPQWPFQFLNETTVVTGGSLAISIHRRISH